MRRVILATTGPSFVLSSLIEERSIHLAGIVHFNPVTTELLHPITEKGIDCYIYDNDINSLKEWIEVRGPDILIIYKMPFLLPKNIFSLPKFGSINIHPSLLPDYRGPNPWFWVYYNMETMGGITIHRVDKYEDHGEILIQKHFDIELGEELYYLQLKAEKLIYPELLNLVSHIDTVKGIQQTSNPLHDRSPNISDYSSIVNLDDMDGIRIWHLLRGFPHLLYLFTKGCQCKYKIGGFISDPDMKKCDIGQIINDGKNLYLYCINGKILLINEMTGE
ncbi:MAG: formyltransferase family protein [Dysgonomonas sp.]|uniref:formyltransferase family protein n=1 Tax=unclassified Dysgonomonas TaxID=2630389 RepID=UPI0018840930|nr:formyltransferase family protein [Dysgonomonas sp. GY75]MBF0651492.1 hypothetical protein [Dysgonomonas sp. GY75]